MAEAPTIRGMKRSRHPEQAASGDWLQQARSLDPTAFDRLIDEYAPRLHGFFRRMCGDVPDVEDLVQEVFIRVVRNIGDYHERGRFEPWLFRIAGNLARDRFRRESIGLRLVTGAEEDGDAMRAIVDRAEPQASATEHSEDADRLQAAMRRLPEAEREVVLLRHYGELSFAEIAELTDAPLGTVLSRAHRGLGKLREWMESRP